MPLNPHVSFEEYLTYPNWKRAQVNLARKQLGLPVYHALTGRPNVNKGKPNLKLRGPRPDSCKPKPWLRGPKPERWLTGPDPERHKMYIPFLKQKAQANFREEGWHMTFEEFESHWQGQWHRRGRSPEDLCMTRKDWEKPWTVDNVELVERIEHFKRQGYARKLNGTLRRAR